MIIVTREGPPGAGRREHEVKQIDISHNKRDVEQYRTILEIRQNLKTIPHSFFSNSNSFLPLKQNKKAAIYRRQKRVKFEMQSPKQQ
nr:hypothetical protein CFP56_19177 [Quercus suber]